MNLTATTPTAPGPMAQLARKLATQGFYVTPLRNDKRPFLPKWTRRATRSHDVVNRWWAENPTAPVGIYTGRYGPHRSGRSLLALDVDKRTDKDGELTLHQLVQELGELPPTRETETPSGGRHLLFEVTAPVRSRVALGVGLDTRGEGGQVVAPGSVTAAGTYRLVRDVAPAMLPEKWAARVGTAPVRDSKAPKIHPDLGDELDGERAVAKALEYLKLAEPAVSYSGGQMTLINVAAHVGDFGITEAKCIELLEASGYNDRCAPPWDPDELAEKVGNAYRYRTSPVGCRHPLVEYPPLPEDQQPEEEAPAERPKRKAKFIPLASIDGSRGGRPLIKGWLDTGDFALMVGAPGQGKSLIAIDMALHVACGRDWHGFKVRPGAVLYVGAENPYSLARRVHAAREYHAWVKPSAPFYLHADPVDLVSGTQSVNAILEAAKDVPGPIRMIVIDTLFCAAPGLRENDSDAMGVVVSRIKSLARATGACTLTLHHSGKDESRGPRGSNSLIAAADASINVTKFKTSIGKGRDNDPTRTMEFEQTPLRVDLGVDEEGDEIFGLVAIPATKKRTENEFAEPKMSKPARRALDAFNEVSGKKSDFSQPASDSFGSVHAPVERDAWRIAYIPRGEFANENSALSSFRGAVSELKDIGIIVERDGLYWRVYAN